VERREDAGVGVKAIQGEQSGVRRSERKEGAGGKKGEFPGKDGPVIFCQETNGKKEGGLDTPCVWNLCGKNPTDSNKVSEA